MTTEKALAEKLERQDLIHDIIHLYPPDVSPTGRDLLWQAILKEWRTLPLSILHSLREKCITKDHEYRKHEFKP